MLQTVKGVYQNGSIILAEIPKNIKKSQVLVTFIDDNISDSIDNNSTDKLFRQLRGKIQYFEGLTTPTTEEWEEI
jgi:hypothetical protein